MYMLQRAHSGVGNASTHARGKNDKTVQLSSVLRRQDTHKRSLREPRQAIRSKVFMSERQKGHTAGLAVYEQISRAHAMQSECPHV